MYSDLMRAYKIELHRVLGLVQDACGSFSSGMMLHDELWPKAESTAGNVIAYIEFPFSSPNQKATNEAREVRPESLLAQHPTGSVFQDPN